MQTSIIKLLMRFMKMKHLSTRLIGIIALTALCNLTTKLQAQVTIGSDKSPAKAALLELKTQEADVDNVTSLKGGLGLPRVQLKNKTTLEPFIANDANFNDNVDKVKDLHVGLTVYNLTSNLSTENDMNKRFRQGIYVWDGNQWNFVYEGQGQRYFFIPSANIPLADDSGNRLPEGTTFNLYKDIYAAQFTKTDNTTFVSSNPNLSFVPSPFNTALYAADALDYVITYYDDNVIKVNSLSPDGILNYDVLTLDTTPASFINVVFVIKEDKLK